MKQEIFDVGAKWGSTKMKCKAIEAYKKHCRFYGDGICTASDTKDKCELQCNLGESFLNELNKQIP